MNDIQPTPEPDDAHMYPPEDYSDYDDDYEPDVVCPRCHGTGMFWDGPEACDHCDGMGYEWWW